ncbi:hypothetical protein B0O99DRAFT_650448 [Bisporella sp. PMI_857]|nr:hypothetical protein B0O99DRAFT_650448 [Bisporella sp. PMI_857]
MATQVNGEKPPTSSASIKHFSSIPVVADGISTFKSNKYGAKSLDLTSAGYEKFVKPIVPYLSGPYQYVSPYVQKADSIGDSAISKLETRFPVVKKPTDEIINDGKTIVFSFTPVKKGFETKDYLLNTYNTEFNKSNEKGLLAYGKAAVGTTLIVSVHTFYWLKSFVGQKGTEAKEATNEKLNN